LNFYSQIRRGGAPPGAAASIVPDGFIRKVPAIIPEKFDFYRSVEPVPPATSVIFKCGVFFLQESPYFLEKNWLNKKIPVEGLSLILCLSPIIIHLMTAKTQKSEVPFLSKEPG
jgi:hypothetical protein